MNPVRDDRANLIVERIFENKKKDKEGKMKLVNDVNYGRPRRPISNGVKKKSLLVLVLVGLFVGLTTATLNAAEPLSIQDLEDVTTTVRTASSYGYPNNDPTWYLLIYGKPCPDERFGDVHLDGNQEFFYDNFSYVSHLVLDLEGICEPLSIEAGDTVTITYDGGQELTIYLPTTTENWLRVYVATDGSTYYDRALTRLAQASPQMSDVAEPLNIQDLEDVTTTLRTAGSYGYPNWDPIWNIRIHGEPYPDEAFGYVALDNNQEFFKDNFAYVSCLVLEFEPFHEPLSIEAGDTVTITYDGGQELTIYLPETPEIEYKVLRLYVASDGSTYYDKALTQLACRPPITIYVDLNNTSGIEDGSFEHPYNTIQEGIAAAGSGDTVLVAEGLYNITERIRITKNGITLKGSGAENTILLAGDTCFYMLGVYKHRYGIENFTIAGFTFNGDSRATGIITGHVSSVTIKNNIFTGCGNDGAILLEEAAGENTITIQNNLIYNCFAGFYGFVQNDDLLEARIFNNTIADIEGEGIYILAENRSTLSGKIINNIIIDGYVGIGIEITDPNVTNLISIAYNDVWKNAKDYTGMGSLYYTPAPGEGAISQNPLFIDPENHDYHLQAGSPCIDAGDPDPIYNDPDGTRNDMGAYGGPGTEVEVLTPDKELEALITTIEEMDIPQQVEGSLEAKLETVLDKVLTAQADIENGDIEHAENMAASAINKINAFINQVKAQSGKKITEEDAAQLIKAAQSLIANIESLVEGL